MHNLIFTEFMKLKRTKILLLIPVGIVVPVTLGIINWIRVRNSYGNVIDMNYLLPFVELEMSNGILMMSIIFIAIWIFVTEYKNSEIVNQFMYPYARPMFMISKHVVILIITSIMVLAVFFLTILFGILVIGGKMNWQLIYYHFKVCLAVILLFFSVVPICVMVCIVSRTYVLPVALAVLIYIMNPQLTGADYLRILPWNVPYYIIQSMQLDLDPRFVLFRIRNYVPYILSSLLTFIVPAIFNAVYYSKVNSLRSGSQEEEVN